jgi:hypothetical protein
VSEEIHAWIEAQPPELQEFAQRLLERIISILASDRSVLLVEIGELRERIDVLESERMLAAVRTADR